MEIQYFFYRDANAIHQEHCLFENYVQQSLYIPPKPITEESESWDLVVMLCLLFLPKNDQVSLRLWSWREAVLAPTRFVKIFIVQDHFLAFFVPFLVPYRAALFCTTIYPFQQVCMPTSHPK